MSDVASDDRAAVALGKVLSLWNIITPKSLGFSGAEATNMAGSGFIMITGFHAETQT